VLIPFILIIYPVQATLSPDKAVYFGAKGSGTFETGAKFPWTMYLQGPADLRHLTTLNGDVLTMAALQTGVGGKADVLFLAGVAGGKRENGNLSPGIWN
jgi:hypothetical protein